MSQENVELLRRLADTLAAGKVPETLGRIRVESASV